MSEAQEKALRDLCERYRVDFDPAHYLPAMFGLPSGYVSGWVGGVVTTIYVGVGPLGEVSS